MDGVIDVALVWGPPAGYAVAREHLPLTAVFIEPEPDAPRLDYRIAMGVRINENDWKRTLNTVLRRSRADIEQVLRDYDVPLLDEEQNKPLDPAQE